MGTFKKNQKNKAGLQICYFQLPQTQNKLIFFSFMKIFFHFNAQSYNENRCQINKCFVEFEPTAKFSTYILRAIHD